MAGVDAAHVEGRVGLDIAETPRLLEHRLVGQAGRLHPRQDVVAGAVHHPHHPLDAVAGEALGQGLDDRDAAGDRGLEADHAAGGLGHLGQLLAMDREQRLVGRDHVLAGGERGLDGLAGDPLLAADQLDEHVHVVAPGEVGGALLPAIDREIGVAVAGAVAGRDRGDLDRPAAAQGEQVGMGLDDLDDADPDRAEAGDSEAQRGRHGGSPSGRRRRIPAAGGLSMRGLGPRPQSQRRVRPAKAAKSPGKIAARRASSARMKRRVMVSAKSGTSSTAAWGARQIRQSPARIVASAR